MEQERLLSPKQLSEIVGLSPAQIRALMNDGRLEFIEISSKTKRLTMSGWERFQRNATKVKSCESERTAAN
ncbi:hypothetical protein Z946_698 [Sulfitobacter noctilucicola]|uniref:Putative DNA-binding transcriptional regulator AlpA n=1 Tax=Sulfitobacter noctilucicola TaxID=1342301 RepID=A0A7W6M745_9RHOB|nr:hypothetical protein [Falsiruegeria mediterranea]KIN61843.1 hypothetical protein Z946_698 [Sulfitobacter noctilucicola]MBB4173636.1 putative DNA-binding transcriptional regulator AlpA [Sulfitobacter noctilucicola]